MAGAIKEIRCALSELSDRERVCVELAVVDTETAIFIAADPGSKGVRAV